MLGSTIKKSLSFEFCKTCWVIYFAGDSLKSSISGLKAKPINAILGFLLFLIQIVTFLFEFFQHTIMIYSC